MKAVEFDGIYYYDNCEKLVGTWPLRSVSNAIRDMCPPGKIRWFE